MVEAQQVRKRRPRWRREVVVSLVLSLVVVFIAYAWGSPMVAALRARDDARPALDAAHADSRSGSATILGFDRGPVYSATYDFCITETDHLFSLGPVAAQHSCQLAYVDFFELPAPNAAVDVAEQEEGTIAPRASMAVDVRDYLFAAGLPEEGLSVGMPDDIQVTLPGATEARVATNESMVDGIAKNDREADAFGSHWPLSESGQGALDPAKRYLVVGETREYFDEYLGCAYGRLWLCGRG